MPEQIPQWIADLIEQGQGRRQTQAPGGAPGFMGPRQLPGLPQLPEGPRDFMGPQMPTGPQPVPTEIAAQLDAKEAAGQFEDRPPMDAQGGYSGGSLRFPAPPDSFPEQAGTTGNEFMGPRQGPPQGVAEMLASRAGGTEDPGFRTPQGGGYPGADLSGATLGPDGPGTATLETPGAPPTAPAATTGETPDERRLRLMTAARQFREGASQFRNITSTGEMMLRGGNVPDRSVRDEDARAEEAHQRGLIEEQRTGDPYNPDSEMSRNGRLIYKQLTGQEAPPTMTAAQLGAFSPMLQKILQGNVAARGDQLQAAATLDRSRRSGRAEDRAVAKAGREEFEFQRDQGDPGAVAGGDLSKLPAEAREELNKDRRAFYSSGRVSELKGMSEAARSIRSRIDASETFGPASAFRALARSAGETGVMTDKDIADFSSRLGRLGVYDKGYQLVAGKISPELKKEIFAVADAFAAAADKALDGEVRTRISSLRQQYPYIQEGTLRNFFLPESEEITPAPDGGTATAGAEAGAEAGKVKVRMIGEDQAIWVDEEDVERGVLEKIWERF